jgi:lycopene cyclase domain-containing protein
MTYAQFLLTFVVVPIVVLAFAVHRRLGVWWFRGLPVVIALAIAYTGPWDHFIISEGVWGYPPGRIWGPTIGLVPLEEYGFFVLQTTFTSLLLLLFLPPGHARQKDPTSCEKLITSPLASGESFTLRSRNPRHLPQERSPRSGESDTMVAPSH